MARKATSSGPWQQYGMSETKWKLMQQHAKTTGGRPNPHLSMKQMRSEIKEHKARQSAKADRINKGTAAERARIRQADLRSAAKKAERGLTFRHRNSILGSGPQAMQDAAAATQARVQALQTRLTGKSGKARSLQMLATAQQRAAELSAAGKLGRMSDAAESLMNKHLMGEVSLSRGLAAKTTGRVSAAALGRAALGVASKAALPLTAAFAAYEAYQGYQKDGVRGAAMGAADSLTFGAASWLAGYSAPAAPSAAPNPATGPTPPAGMKPPSGQGAAFINAKAEAKAATRGSATAESPALSMAKGGPRGWANPAVQKAAQAARRRKGK